MFHPVIYVEVADGLAGLDAGARDRASRRLRIYTPLPRVVAASLVVQNGVEESYSKVLPELSANKK